ncbi:phosphatase domain-containing putative toxin [Microbulbifer epialgicus]|uniref:Protein-tyrosine phosphatase family protein n=1 Tax=Microbulbifer epialgicus TaxID=393907 RepID=A0ABV4P5Q3_9GAMM
MQWLVVASNNQMERNKMYVFNTFDQRVNVANSSFNEGRSSLSPLYTVLRNAGTGQASIADILGAIRPMSATKKSKYRNALNYLLINLVGEMQPQNFSWMSPGIGGMSKFDSNPDLDKAGLWLYKKNVRTVITIESSGAAATKNATYGTFPDFKWFSCFLADWHAPSVKQLVRYCETVQERYGYGAVATHCWGGTGRTGCFLAAWSLFTRSSKTAQEALKKVRRQYNTHSVEMKAQYNTLARFSDHLGYAASKTYDDITLDHAGGHWHPAKQNYGINQDPGHAGSGGGTGDAVFKKLVGQHGVANSQSPYVTDSPTAHVQVVNA